MRVLVGYASWHGSTAGVARGIATALEQGGNTVEVLPVAEVDGLAGYDAVVVGSAVHNQSWLPEAADFVRRNTAALSGRPVWLFSVGMTGGLPRPLRRAARTGQERSIAAALRGDVQPRGHRVFSGVCRSEQLPQPGRILFRAVGGHFGDYRDWPAIEAWAREIAEELRAQTAAEGP
jgi:menaquinone-dependent protoporphyrinogen oxidase